MSVTVVLSCLSLLLPWYAYTTDSPRDVVGGRLLSYKQHWAEEEQRRRQAVLKELEGVHDSPQADQLRQYLQHAAAQHRNAQPAPAALA